MKRCGRVRDSIKLVHLLIDMGYRENKTAHNFAIVQEMVTIDTRFNAHELTIY